MYLYILYSRTRQLILSKTFWQFVPTIDYRLLKQIVDTYQIRNIGKKYPFILPSLKNAIDLKRPGFPDEISVYVYHRGTPWCWTHRVSLVVYTMVAGLKTILSDNLHETAHVPYWRVTLSLLFLGMENIQRTYYWTGQILVRWSSFCAISSVKNNVKLAGRDRKG